MLTSYHVMFTLHHVLISNDRAKPLNLTNINSNWIKWSLIYRVVYKAGMMKKSILQCCHMY